MAIYKSIYKKLLAAGTAAVVMASVAAPSGSEAAEVAVPFKDVTGNYLSPVEYLYSNGIVKGTGTLYGTSDSMTRGTTAIMIARALGLENEIAPDAGFPDVDGQYTNAVNNLSYRGIISGSGGKFLTSKKLTRGEMAKILVKAYNIPMNVKDSPFKDAATGAFADYIDAIYAAGITNGVSADSFGSNNEIKRGDFATLLFKTINRFGAGCDYDPNSTINPNSQTINCLITEVARESNVPPEIVKAVAEKESGWKQFENGKPYMNTKGDGGIGMMQITNKAGYTEQQLGYNVKENIKAGVNFLTTAFYNRYDLPKINNHDPKMLESWYFAVMAYNGIVPLNSPIVQATGNRNTLAYQELVFDILDKRNLHVDDPQLEVNIDKLDMKKEEFQYDPNSGTAIKFLKDSYQLDAADLTSTKQLFKVGDIVTYNANRLRAIPSTDGSQIDISTGSRVKIIGEPMADQNSQSVNHFVWYLVQDVNTRKIGYIASPYIK